MRYPCKFQYPLVANGKSRMIACVVNQDAVENSCEMGVRSGYFHDEILFLIKQRLKPIQRFKQLVPIPQPQRPGHCPLLHRVMFIARITDHTFTIKLE